MDQIILLFFINIFFYQVKVTHIENNFKNMYQTIVEKHIYLSSELEFDVKSGDVFKLYRFVEEMNNKTKKNTDKSKETKEKTDKKENKETKDDKKNEKKLLKICIYNIQIINVVNNTIKAIPLSPCENSNFITDFQTVKINDFIEIETFFDVQKDIYKLSASEEIFLNIMTQSFSLKINENETPQLKKPEEKDKTELKKDNNQKKDEYKKLPKKDKNKNTKELWEIKL